MGTFIFFIFHTDRQYLYHVIMSIFAWNILTTAMLTCDGDPRSGPGWIMFTSIKSSLAGFSRFRF